MIPIPEINYQKPKPREEIERDIWQPWIDLQNPEDGFGYFVKWKYFDDMTNRVENRERIFHSLDELKWWWENSWREVQVVEMRQKHSLVNRIEPGNWPALKRWHPFAKLRRCWLVARIKFCSRCARWRERNTVDRGNRLMACPTCTQSALRAAVRGGCIRTFSR